MWHVCLHSKPDIISCENVFKEVVITCPGGVSGPSSPSDSSLCSPIWHASSKKQRQTDPPPTHTDKKGLKLCMSLTWIYWFTLPRALVNIPLYQS